MNKILTQIKRTWHAVAAPALSGPGGGIGSPVHVLDVDARIRLDDGLLTIGRPDQPPIGLRLPDVLSVSVHGRAGITTPAVHALLTEGIPLIWRSETGYYLGQTVDLSRQTARVRRAQYAAHGTPLALAIAARLVAAKITNMHALLRRRSADASRTAAACSTLLDLARRAPAAVDMDALRGLEGAASAAYFGCWPNLLKGPAAALGFPGRKRRPPVGPVNALISYSYAVLAGHCSSAVTGAGLDPAEGFLHVARSGRPSLALDLLEPFRPTVADSAALFALNTGAVTAGDFVEEDGGTRLDNTGRRAALAALERRLDEGFTDTDGQRVTYRAAIERAAHSLARALTAASAEPLMVPVRP
jgi:CRISPR-associated endonuclease Cas1